MDSNEETFSKAVDSGNNKTRQLLVLSEQVHRMK